MEYSIAFFFFFFYIERLDWKMKIGNINLHVEKPIVLNNIDRGQQYGNTHITSNNHLLPAPLKCHLMAMKVKKPKHQSNKSDWTRKDERRAKVLFEKEKIVSSVAEGAERSVLTFP